MWLAVDSGNTRIKWALVRGRRMTKTGASSRGLSALAAAARKCDEVVIADVVGKKRRGDIMKALPDAVCFIPPPPLRQGGLCNHYRKPNALGIDRWLAMLAATGKNKDAVIADAGTALTIDALTGDGDFIGGIIVPGAKLMRRALSQKTGLAGGALLPPPSLAAGRDTKAAMAAGIAAAMAGAVLAFRRRVLPRAAIIITGGDAGELLPWLPRAVLHKPHLVMEGIIRWRELRL
ncbi:MAG: type III pantothenate kinase [Gammaproteobacteria bacterium]